jgi:pyruvate,water dikinase
VPNGFIVTVSAFEEYLKQIEFANTLEELDRELCRLNSATAVKALSLRARSKLLAGEGKAAAFLKRELSIALSRLAGDFFAVRSSANMEDGRETSFAGQFDTRLNVRKPDVLDAVVGCWCSLFNSRALWTAKAAGIGLAQCKMAVVVQEMVHADFSGVVLTQSPSNSKDLLVEAIQGYGENLVSGSVNPDQQCSVSRETRTVGRNVGSHLMEEGLVSELARLALSVEDVFGEPQDIEYAAKDKEMYLLQSRPEVKKEKDIPK